ncbi:hypothetical protein [Streptomyces sp. DH8]|nr:hypothetical protein [Streptomyces sp. DH8]
MLDNTATTVHTVVALLLLFNALVLALLLRGARRADKRRTAYRAKARVR